MVEAEDGVEAEQPVSGATIPPVVAGGKAKPLDGSPRRVSSVPEGDFRTPETIDDIQRLADIGSDILAHVMDYINDGEYRILDHEHWRATHDVLVKPFTDVVAAYSYITKMKWPVIRKEAA